MKTAYIFHDSFSDQYADWYPWMKTTLQSGGYNVIVPVFPTPAGQSLESWMVVMKNYTTSFDEETIFIGHGTGAMFALRLLESSAKQIRGLYCVAGYAEKIGHAGYDRVNESFLVGDFKWETIRSRAMIACAFAGDHDPFVPHEATERFAKNLGIPLDVISDGGHLNHAAGFSQFVALASKIREGDGVIGNGMEVVGAVPPELHNPLVGSQPSPTLLHSQRSDRIPKGTEFALGQGGETEPVAMQTPFTIHTMYADMTTLVNSNSGEVASSLLSQARTDDKIKQEQSPTSTKNILYFTGSLIATMVAVFAVGYVVRVYLPAQKNIAAQSVPSIISAQSHQKIDVLQPSYVIAEKIRAVLAVPPIATAITDIYYVKNSMRATFPSVLDAMEITTLPEVLKTELAQPVFMHGSANAAGAPAHFLILPIANYDSAFAGLHEWEPTMFRDIGIFMNVPDSFLKTKITKDSFKDEMIANRNLRVLRYTKTDDIDFNETAPVVSSSTTMITPSTTPASAPSINADATPPNVGGDSAAVATVTNDSTNISNFISEGIAAVQNQNPFANIVSPYNDGDIMIAYFFLTEKTIVVVDNLDIIPEILSRFANRQIYQ